MSASMDDLKILIAEDHFPARQMLSTALRAKGSPLIDVAVEGKSALEMIIRAANEGKPYNIVFLDWEMPEMTGIEILKHCRENQRFANTAFVMVTAMSIKEQVMDAIKSGATAYVIKPASEQLLVKRFMEIVSWLKLRGALA